MEVKATAVFARSRQNVDGFLAPHFGNSLVVAFVNFCRSSRVILKSPILKSVTADMAIVQLDRASRYREFSPTVCRHKSVNVTGRRPLIARLPTSL